MIYRLLLLFLLIGFAQMGYSSSPLDSLRTEKIKGKKYVIHRAEPKETLYSIAKRYGVSVDELYAQNTTLKSDGLKMYDEIRVPLSKKKNLSTPEPTEAEKPAPTRIHVVQQGETLFAISRRYDMSVDSLSTLNSLENAHLDVGDTLYLAPVKGTTSTPASDTNKYHTVQPSETLFGISRMYQVEIEDIQQWNSLPDYTLSIGQQLIVSKGAVIASEKEVVIEPIAKKEIVIPPTQPEKPTLDTLYVKTDNSQFKTKTSDIKGLKTTVEEGFAMKIEDTDYTQKYLALHRTAPLGTTIVIKNQMTNQSIEARVVGKLPESAMNRTLLVRLSSAAYKAMGALDLKTPVIASYTPDNE
ncbi:LysM peptidoglycan-binding domain-containing protein [Reichenbachiella carrageenanivorans]|uniref:LysM peptidoglycan-binding domain-containing protein n=1 Tax=Reichenbachiella carrageenanivorans TaxID=2979869 RepID=A0ABY6CZ75_9BACT|nr:LysM peptidoglycan-binding domain-containing protein [Reichenbachiella carrageenanivorans]UXX78118.1 LysM peptidoglycan-binding domain-containing protein [Reichenbachiella carrageenanivorans]